MLNLVRILSLMHLISFPVIIKCIAAKKIRSTHYPCDELMTFNYFVGALNFQ